MTSSENPRRLALPVLMLLTALAAGLPPGMSAYRDSGDLAAAGATLGIAHPPGYPAYSLLGRAWTAFLPLGDPAWRLNLLSSAAGAAAAGAAALLALRAAGPAGACAAFLLFAGAPAVRTLSRVSEMYSLLALFAAGVALCWTAPDGAPRRRAACLAGLLTGLGLGLHQTLLLTLPACAAALGLRRAGWKPWAFLGLGLAVHLYLPIRSAADPAVNWGSAETAAGLAKMLTRYYYGGARLHPDRAAGILQPSHWGPALAYAGRLFWEQWGAGGTVLAAAGLISRSPLRTPLALGFLMTGPAFILWADLDPAAISTAAILEPHLVLPAVFAAGLAGLGAARIEETSRGRAGAVFLGGLLLLQALRLAPISAGGGRGDYSAEDLGKGLTRSLGRRALLVDPDDQSAFALAYLQAVRAVRTDIVPLVFFRTWWGFERIQRLHPELLPAQEIRSGQDLLAAVVGKAHAEGRPIFVDFPGKAPFGNFPMPGAWGYRLAARPPDRKAAGDLLARALPSLELDSGRGLPADPDFFSRHAGSFRTAAWSNLATLAQSLGRFGLAERIHLSALRWDPELSESWNNLANALLAQGKHASAVGCYRAALSKAESSQIRYNLGRALVLSGREEEARPELERADREGGVPDAANDLGLLELKAGRVQEAIRIFNALLSRRPEYALAYYNLGVAHERLGDRAAAEKFFTRFEELRTGAK